MKPKFPRRLSPALRIFPATCLFAMGALPILAQNTFEWTGGETGTGTNLFGSGGHSNWDPELIAGDIATGTANIFRIATRIEGGPEALIGGGSDLTLSASPRMGQLVFDDSESQFPDPLVIRANLSGTSARVIWFEQPDTTLISLDNSVTSVVKLGIGASGTDENAFGNFSLRLPASGTSTFHVANAAATLDLSGLFDNVTGRAGIHGGEIPQSLDHAKIRKTGEGTLDLRTADAQGNRVLGTIIEGGTVIVGRPTELGWNPAEVMPDHIVINGGTLRWVNTTASLGPGSSRGFMVGENIGAISVEGASLTIPAVITDVPGQAGVLAKKGTFILNLNGANTYSGGTLIEEGRIAFNSSGAFGSGPITLGENAGLGATASSTSVVNNIVFQGSAARFGMGTFINTLDGEIDLNGGVRTFSLSNSLIHNNTISNGGLTLQSDLNAQRLELNGSNSYEGATTVDRGRLVVNGEITSNVTVTRGVTDELGIGSLGGEGFVSGSVTISGELRPGPNTADSPGTLQITGALTLGETSEAIFEISDEFTADKVTELTSVNLDGKLTITLLGDYEPEIGATFDLIDSAAAPVLGSNFSFNLPALPAGRAWDTSSFASDGSISVVEGGANAYELWAASFDLSGDDALPASDPDSDGFTNAQEFAFGTDPATSTGSLVGIETSDSTVIVTYIERDSDVSYVVQSSATLTPPWNPAVDITYLSPVDQTGVPAGYTRKQFTSAVGTRDFFRVEAGEIE